VIRRALFAGIAVLSLAVAGCGGAGLTGTCDDTDSYCPYVPPVDTPTDSPTDSPTDPPQPGPTPLPAGCVDYANLLYPETYPSAGYGDTVYVALPPGEKPGTFLAVLLTINVPGSASYKSEFGTPLRDVTGAAPSYVPAPPNMLEHVYASSNLPLPMNNGLEIVLIDMRNPPVCDLLTLAQFGTFAQAHRRAPHRKR